MLSIIPILSLFTIGYCCTFWDGMIFQRVADYLDERLPEWLQLPLYRCFICACFWWGSALYWIVWGNSITEWFVCVVAAMGLNAALSKIFRDD